MARPGDTLLDPRSGRRLVFRRTAAQTGGRTLEFDLHFQPREPRTEEHTHAIQEHLVEVLRGELKACVGGRVQVLRPGDVLLIGAGDSHVIWNGSGRATHAVWHTFPALDTESTIESTWRPTTTAAQLC